MEGGASIRRAGQVFANFGGAKRLMVGDDPDLRPLGCSETNSSYTSPNKNGLSNGHYFSHWEINGVFQADNQAGLSRKDFVNMKDEGQTVITLVLMKK